MYELIQLTERTYYIKSPTNIGLFRLDEKNVCLIDSGNDKDAGRRIRQVLDANGWQLTAIYNTHANADHIGGNRYLQGQTAAGSTRRESTARLSGTRCWSRRFSTADIRPRTCGTSFCWHRRATRRS